MELTKEKQVLYDKYTGKFSTPKKLNRSGKIVPQEYIDKIEDSEVTSIMLGELNKIVPIFIYKTCVTIHGVLPKIETTRIGGYKNVTQNKNGSLEIRYSAIDYQYKKQTAYYLNMVNGWHSNENSTSGIYFIKSFRTTNKQEAIEKYNEFKAHADAIDVNGLFAKIFVTGQNYFGMYYIEINILPLSIVASPRNIAIHLSGMPYSYFEEITHQREEKDREHSKKMIALEKKRNEARQLALMQVAALKQEPVSNIVGSVYVKPSISTENNPLFIFTRVDKIGSFGKIAISQYRSHEMTFDPILLKPYPKQVKPSEMQNTYRYL